MELVEKYVQAVKQYLPDGQQNDIARELAENIHAQMEDREEALGRPLTTAEQEAILKRLGNPAVVAEKYQTNPQRLTFGRELIGPVLFPLYTRVLLISLTLMALGNFLATVFMGSDFGDFLPSMALKSVTQFAIITGIFIALQAHLTRYPDVWDPRDPSSPLPLAKDERRVPRTESLFEIVLIVVMLFVIRAFPATAPDYIAELGFGTVWALGYWSVYGLTLASVVPPVIAFFCPSWTVFRAGANVVFDVVWLGVLIYILAAGPWFGVAGAGTHPLTALINQWMPWGLGIVLFFTLVELGVHSWKLTRQMRLQRG